MKKNFHLSVVIGRVVGPTEAAQGQTEEAQAPTELISVVAPPSSPRWMLDDSRLPIEQGSIHGAAQLLRNQVGTLRLSDVLTKANAAQLTTAAHRRKQ